jgi:glutamate--cysteine ligase
MLDLARTVVAISAQGLTRRAKLNSAGDNESGFLGPLNETVASGKTPAERLLDLYNGPWQGDLSRIYSEMSF